MAKRRGSPHPKQNRSEKGRSPRKRTGAAGSPASAPTAIPRGARAVVGTHSCREAIKVRPHAISEIWLRQNWDDSQDLREFAEWSDDYGVLRKEVSNQSLDEVCPSHQGVVLLLTEKPVADFEAFAAPDKKTTLLALDQISDPHNVGAILRTAWLMGVSAVLIPEMRSSGLTPAAIKVASGAAEHVPLVNVGNLAQELSSLKDKGFWVYGLSAGETSQQLWSLDLPDKVVWVVGSEEKGLRKPVEKACEQLVRIPQLDSAASFNASVAASLAMGETVRQAASRVST